MTCRRIVAALTCVLAVPLIGQATGAGRRGSISGVVFDSLVTNAPLAGAEITIDGTELSALTDVRGRFRIDGAPTGRAVVRFYHTTLDSLGFGAPSSF